MSNLAYGKVILKFDNSVVVQKKLSSLCSNFILNLYTVYESNPTNVKCNPTNNYILKIVYLVQSN